ncbi:MAG: AAA family ATPase, partial [Candidatus Pacebacteria bacterium]|nr:AAA family ATPase [Candidatus Paceibacterota bacterium]
MFMVGLFDENLEGNIRENAPLADRMRPVDFNSFFGQDELIGEKSSLRKVIQNDALPSIIFWGPPGSGKTTLSKIIAHKTESFFVEFSAVMASINDVRKAIAKAKEDLKFNKKKTIIFIDEIHRFNKAQQDALLPSVEQGIVTLIGATTENPSFEVISPLLSRSIVYILKPLSDQALKNILIRALEDKKDGLANFNLKFTDRGLSRLIVFADGDARAGLNALEFISNSLRGKSKTTIGFDEVLEILKEHSLRYDKRGEEHYNLISALHKSMRDSDPDAA